MKFGDCHTARNSNENQGTLIYNRKKDQESDTGKWFAELTQPDPWYKDVVPDVCQYRADENTDIS